MGRNQIEINPTKEELIKSICDMQLESLTDLHFENIENRVLFEELGLNSQLTTGNAIKETIAHFKETFDKPQEFLGILDECDMVVFLFILISYERKFIKYGKDYLELLNMVRIIVKSEFFNKNGEIHGLSHILYN